MIKISGPYGSYPPESVGATMNKLCTQENLSSWIVSDYSFSDKCIYLGQRKVADYEWEKDQVTFKWKQ